MRKIDVLFAGFISAALIGFWVFISPVGTARVSEAAPTSLTDPTQQTAGKSDSVGVSYSAHPEGGDDVELTPQQRARRDALARIQQERKLRQAQDRERKLSAAELSRLRERKRDTPPAFLNDREFTPPTADAERLPTDSSAQTSTRPVYY